MRHITTIAAALPLALAGCEGASEIEPVEDDTTPTDTANTPDRANMGAPLINRDTDELGSDAVSQGEWVSKQMAGAPAALFGPPDTEAAFSVRCADGELVFTRNARIEGGGPVEMALMAEGETRRIDASAKTDPLPQVTGRLAASDPFADLLGTTRRPIAVAVGDGVSYPMPSSAPLRRVVSNCAA